MGTKRENQIFTSLSISKWFCLASVVLFMACAKQATSAPMEYSGPYQPLSSQGMDNLVAPIALYPDPLMMQVLQASANQDDIAKAAAWVQVNTDPSQLSQEPWSPSVIAIAKYPSVVTMMNNKFNWTTQLNLSYVNQPEDLFGAVQRLRRQAKEHGNLVTNEQQKVVVSNNTIQIVPASPQVIYVPTYNPSVVYTEVANPYAPMVGFVSGLAIGSAMSSSSTVNYYGTSSAAYYHGPVGYSYSSGNTQYAAGAGYRGYAQGTSTSGTGAYGNKWTSTNVSGGTWNGGSFSGHAQTNDWANGAKTGSYSASGSGPNGSASARGWGYQNGSNEAGGFSRSGTTANGAYNIHGSGASNGSQSGGSVTASGVNKEGDYESKTWTGNDGNRTSTSSSGNLFGDSHSGSSASDFSKQGWESRSSSFGGGSFGGGRFSGFQGGGGGFGGFHGGGGFRR